MLCPNCNMELTVQRHYWPDENHAEGVVEAGLPNGWYSHQRNSKMPQEGGFCYTCKTHYMKIDNGDLYVWALNGTIKWIFLKKTKVSARKNREPIGGKWQQ
jgi:hypothetical protein